ncbi:MAG TPA: SUF system Fe-S cluster assembly regulator [Steroidobacteraceae bacterium]|nr:SUF system Fe-S cluster assembly regulator [Steroidobacteraceae bacterium]
MLRISKLTDYGTVILACLASTPGRRQTASEIAERTRLGLPTVSKLLKNFHRAGLVTSARGAHGGYELARPAARISAAAIIDAIEGPVAITECSGNHSACDIENVCRTGGAWQHINGAIRRSLDEISLAQLSGQEAVALWRPELASTVRTGTALRSLPRT